MTEQLAASVPTSPVTLAPCLYEGTVIHDRRGDQPHRLRRTIQMVFVDTADLSSLTRLHPLGSTRTRRPVELRRSDCFGDPTIPLDQAVADEVVRLGGQPPRGPIALLATPRTWGWNFNPITSYYCYDETGTEVTDLLVEVTNTPWGERHTYLVGAPGRHRFAKDFHVSPFLPMDLAYEIRYAAPAERCTMSFDVTENGETRLRASMALHRVAPTAVALRRIITRPWLSSPGVSASIYANAVALLAKRAPVFRHPSPKEATP